MFRTITFRGTLIHTTFKRNLRPNNLVRSFGIECAKRRHHRLFLRESKHKICPLTSSGLNLIRNYSSYPPHLKITLPALSPTMDQGSIVSWSKKEGDKLNEGDVLAEIETDKATMAFETPEEGYLAKILVPAGTKDIPVGKLVCIIVENKEDVDKFKEFKDDGSAAAAPPPPKKEAAAPPPPPPAAAAPPPPPPSSSPPSAAAAPSSSSGRIKASPMARRLAEIQGLRLQGQGSGLYGSITSSDLGKMGAGAPKAASAAAPAGPPKPRPPPGGHIDIPISGMRSTIAKRLVMSKTTIPHYYLTVEVNVENLLRTREVANEKYKKDKIRLSVNDFIIKAVAVASTRVPEVNAQWMDTVIRQFSDVDVSVAVATDKGLLTPIVWGANNLTVLEISQEVKRLAGKAREGKLQPQEFQGGTISVSNLGMFDMTSMCSIINPPQSGILAVGAAVNRLILDPKTSKGFREIPIINLTYSGDHRVVDGALGATWLKEVKLSLEEPGTMVI